jgi:hypothetical protein
MGIKVEIKCGTGTAEGMKRCCNTRERREEALQSGEVVTRSCDHGHAGSRGTLSHDVRMQQARRSGLPPESL